MRTISQTIDGSRLIRKRREKKFFSVRAHSALVALSLRQRGRRELLTATGIVQTFSIYLENIGNYVGEAIIEFLDSFATVYNFGQIDRALLKTEFLAAVAIRWRGACSYFKLR